MNQKIHSSFEQQQAISSHHSCWVEASAGTGKTKVLTDRVLNLLLNGAPAEHILCLTFTKAAAAEMANRIQENLSNWASLTKDDLSQALQGLLNRLPTPEEMERAQKLFSIVIDTPGGMKIQTIHSFCQTILKKFPLEAEIPPHFTVMNDSKSHALLKESFQKTLDVLPQPLLETLSNHANPQQLFDLLSSLSHRRPKINAIMAHAQSFESLSQKIYQTLKVPFHLKPLTLLENNLRDTDIPLKAFRDILPFLETGNEKERKMGDFLKNCLMSTPSERARQFNAYKLLFLTLAGEPRKTFISADLKKNTPSIPSLFAKEAERLQNLDHLYNHSVIAEATEAFMMFILFCFDHYKSLKTMDAALDYDDLIHITAALFQKPDIAPWVLYKLDGGTQHILVDEAQDTNEYQWQVIASIASEFFAQEPDTENPRTLFVVGDMKQSIYSFQGASPLSFQAMKDLFSKASGEANHPWAEIDLSTSFRSTEPILSLVDTLFQKYPKLSPSGLTLPYLSHTVHRVNHGGHVEIWPLVERIEKEERATWEMPNKQIKTTNPRKDLAQRIALQIQTWMKERKILPSKNRPIAPKDIMILVRRRDQFVEELVRALKNLSIPVTGVDRLILKDNIAVMDLLALGDFLLLPEDDLSLATILKCPLIAMAEEDLFHLAYTRKDKSLWHALKKESVTNPIYEKAFNFLKDLMNLVDFCSPFDLYSHILNTLSGRKLMVGRLGTEVEDALEEFLNFSLSFSNEAIGSLQEFLSWMRLENTEIKRNLDQSNEDKVRIMTVHGAKGLQAPIVFLPDTTQVPLGRSTIFWEEGASKDPLLFWCPKARFKTDYIHSLHPQFDEMAEYYRLLYVALTRAEDQLYVCGWAPQNKGDEHHWYATIMKAAQEIGTPFMLEIAGESYGEGLMVHKDPSHSVHEPLHEDAPPPHIQEPSWLFQIVQPETVPKVVIPSTIKTEDPLESRGPAYSIPHAERGILIHKALEWLVKDPGEERLQLIERFLAQRLESAEVAVTVDILEKTITLLRPYFGEGTLLTEVPLHSFNKENKTLIKGTMDLLWVEDEKKHVHIIDYKTGYFDSNYAITPPPSYREQMRLYEDVVAKIYPDYTIQTFILWTSVQQLCEIH